MTTPRPNHRTDSIDLWREYCREVVNEVVDRFDLQACKRFHAGMILMLDFGGNSVEIRHIGTGRIGVVIHADANGHEPAGKGKRPPA